MSFRAESKNLLLLFGDSEPQYIPNSEIHWTFGVRRSTFITRFMQTSAQSSIDLPGIKKLRSGKVREVFDLGETLLFVVTERISAFDVILPDPIPRKGAVL